MKTPRGLRSRIRADGSTRMWWEPSAAARKAGHQAVELDAERPTWSAREAARLNADVDGAHQGARGRTIADLRVAYCSCPGYQRKAAATRKSYEANLRAVCDRWGSTAVAEISKPAMFSWYESLVRDRGEHAALAIVRMASILFAHAERIGWRADNSNPCLRLGMSVPQGRDRVATWQEFDALLNTADDLELPQVALAIGLSALQGQRQTTVATARRQDFRKETIDGQEAWVWSFVRSKRRNKGVTPIHRELVARLEELLERPGDPGDFLLGLTQANLRKRWDQVRAATSLFMPSVLDLQFRDLRRTFGHWSRAGGATKDDTADVLGNSAAADPLLAEIYMAPQVATARRAVDAINRGRLH